MGQNKEKERIFFDNFVRNNNEYIGLSDKSYKILYNELIQSISISNKNLNIIDLGCGTATFTKKLQNISNNVYGCDISIESIKKAKKLHPNITFINEDVENLSLEDEFFDVVILSGVLHHFKNMNKIFSESRRILKKKGLIFSFDPNLRNPFFWLYRRKNSFFYSSKGVTENEQPLIKENIIKAMQLAHFNKIDVKCISGMPFKFIDSKKLRIFLPIYNLIDSFFGIIPFIRNTYGSFVITKGFK